MKLFPILSKYFMLLNVLKLKMFLRSLSLRKPSLKHQMILSKESLKLKNENKKIVQREQKYKKETCQSTKFDKVKE